MTNLDAKLREQGPVVSALRADLTSHAAIRARQRGIDLHVLRCLLLYGRREHDHHGAELVTFDNRSLKLVQLREPRGTWMRAAESRTLYAVVDSTGSVITAGHRSRRVFRDPGRVPPRRRKSIRALQ